MFQINFLEKIPKEAGNSFCPNVQPVDLVWVGRNLQKNPEIILLGSDPSSICAAHRFQQLGYENWKLISFSTKLFNMMHDPLPLTEYSYFNMFLDSILPEEVWNYVEIKELIHFAGGKVQKNM